MCIILWYVIFRSLFHLMIATELSHATIRPLCFYRSPLLCLWCICFVSTTTIVYTDEGNDAFILIIYLSVLEEHKTGCSYWVYSVADRCLHSWGTVWLGLSVAADRSLFESSALWLDDLCCLTCFILRESQSRYVPNKRNIRNNTSISDSGHTPEENMRIRECISAKIAPIDHISTAVE